MTDLFQQLLRSLPDAMVIFTPSASKHVRRAASCWMLHGCRVLPPARLPAEITREDVVEILKELDPSPPVPTISSTSMIM